MNHVVAKVIPIGNSYGVRLSREDMRRYGLKPGDEVDVSVHKRGNVSDALAQMEAYASKKRHPVSIDEITSWQKHQRDWPDSSQSKDS